MKGVHEGQLSLFDMFNVPQEAAPEPVQDLGPSVVEEARPVPVSIQASMKVPDGSYRVFGTIRAEIILSAWSPSTGDVLKCWPIISEYYIPKGLLERGLTVDLFAHELDADGVRRMLPDARAAICTDDLFVAAGA